MKKITKAILPVAGYGTRFLPATKSLAKETFPIVDTPALLLVLEECLDSGINDVFIVLREGKEYIKDLFVHDKKLEENLKKKNQENRLFRLNRIIDNMRITFGYQKEDCIGSAGACYVAKDWAQNQPFAVLFADDLNYTPEGTLPAIGQLIRAYEQTEKMIIGCKVVGDKEICNYSSCIIKQKINDSLYEISGIAEKPSFGKNPSNIAGLARYIMPSNTFKFIEQQIQNTPKGEEIGLTDTMDLIMKEDPAYAVIMDSKRYDIGDKLGYLEAFTEYALRDEHLGTPFRNYLKSLKL